MADYFWSRISFPKALAERDEEIKSLLDVEYKDESVNVDIEVYSGIMSISDSRAHNGQFEQLEDLLTCSGIPFDRESEAFAEYDSTIRYYRPATTQSEEIDECVLTNKSGNPVIEFDEVRSWIQNNPEKTTMDLLDELIENPKIIDIYQYGRVDFVPFMEEEGTYFAKDQVIANTVFGNKFMSGDSLEIRLLHEGGTSDDFKLQFLQSTLEEDGYDFHFANEDESVMLIVRLSEKSDLSAIISFAESDNDDSEDGVVYLCNNCNEMHEDYTEQCDHCDGDIRVVSKGDLDL